MYTMCTFVYTMCIFMYNMCTVMYHRCTVVYNRCTFMHDRCTAVLAVSIFLQGSIKGIHQSVRDSQHLLTYVYYIGYA